MEAHAIDAPPPVVADTADTYVDRGPAAYMAELFGTFTLVFVVTMVVSIYGAVATPTNPNPYVHWEVIGLVHVFVLFMLIQTLAVVSGAHFNPAVTVALTVLRQIRPADALIYIVCQLAGAVAGTLITKELLTDFKNADALHYGATLMT